MIAMRLGPNGLTRGEFVDRNGQGCSIQDSSIADEDRIWLGVHAGLNGPGERMHLTRAMAADLIPLLQEFVDTGFLPLPTPSHGDGAGGIAGEAR